MNQDIEKIISRIRKLLALAENNPSEHEAASAAAMAEKMMRKYQIDHAAVLASTMEVSDVGEEFEWTGKKAVPWREWLAVTIARTNDCEVQYRGHGLSMGFVFMGVQPDPIVAAEIYKYLTEVTHRLSIQYGGGRRAINSFQAGCARRLCERLREMTQERKEEFEKAAGGTALVIHKAALIEQKYGKASYGKAKSHSASDWDAYAAGARAANSVSLNKQIQ